MVGDRGNAGKDVIASSLTQVAREVGCKSGEQHHCERVEGSHLKLSFEKRGRTLLGLTRVN